MDPRRCVRDRTDRVREVLSLPNRLDLAPTLEHRDAPGSGLHALADDMRGRYGMTVSHNRRRTFRWNDGDAADLDLEGYHG